MQSISAVTAVLTCMLCSGPPLSFANIASYMHSQYIQKPDHDILQALQQLLGVVDNVYQELNERLYNASAERLLNLAVLIEQKVL